MPEDMAGYLLDSVHRVFGLHPATILIITRITLITKRITKRIRIIDPIIMDLGIILTIVMVIIIDITDITDTGKRII
jgi:hypothetical protein